jgi:replication factor C small subunit
MEEYSSNVRFILTCNYVDRITPHLKSRLTDFEFIQPPVKSIFKRMVDILTKEGVDFSGIGNKGLLTFCMKYAHDMRKMINILERVSMSGNKSIGSELLSYADQLPITNIVTWIKNGDFDKLREQAAKIGFGGQSSVDRFYHDFYQTSIDYTKSDAKTAELIMILHDYMYKSKFVDSHEVNLSAFLYHLSIKGVFS